MQPGQAGVAVGVGSQAFSILGRIGGDATEDLRLELPRATFAFSILGRIGGDATRP